MLQLPGYQIDSVLSLGARSIVYRGQRNQDQKPVVVKMRTHESLSPHERARFRYAYEISSQIDLPGVCKPYELLEHEKRPVLVMEDIGGQSLSKMIADKVLDVSGSLLVSIQLASTLDKLHQQYIIHKDIKPANILLEPTQLRVQFIDFELASNLSKQMSEVKNLSSLEGTLGYISPEQTGRMNRSVDHRSDLYSLGVTFYEMFVGKLPFSAVDPIGLVHSHIAVMPTAPHIENPTVPMQISKIIMKLMAKAPEERYQSAYGLHQDLQRCLDQYLQTGSVPLFALGQNDFSPNLQISQRLYGRENEIRQLMKAYRSASVGVPGLLLVGGYSGVGKTSLIREVHKPIAQSNGRFIMGKFNQYQNAPFAAISEAFSQLVQDVLKKPEEEIKFWRQKIQSALGGHGQLIQDVIPELSLLLGEQPPVPSLSPTEAQNRFYRTFVRFVGVFTNADSPLVVFLDDLQWATSASIGLLKLFLTDSSTKYLFVLGAYRDNEVSNAHPLHIAINELVDEEIPFQQVKLNPLCLNDVRLLLSDSLLRDVNEVTPLAESVYAKTNGNPFFMERFLQSMYEQGFIFQDKNLRQWCWEIDGIQNCKVSDNVADLMAQQIQKLPEPTQKLVRFASCIGNRFRLKLLAELTGLSIREAARDLWPAVKEDLLFPLGELYRFIEFEVETSDSVLFSEVEYQFAHDRIQEGANILMQEEERAQIHLTIGRTLKNDDRVTSQPEFLFNVINHLNYGASLLTDKDERDELSGYNLLASRRAMDASAWQSSLHFISTGIELLPEDIWELNHNKAFEFHFALLNSAVACSDFELWQEQEELLLRHSKNLKEKVSVSKLKVKRHVITGEHGLAVEAALETLSLFDFEVPDSPENWQAAVVEEGTRIAQVLAKRNVASLIDLPKMTDPDSLLEIDVLVELAPTSMGKPEFFAVAVSRMARLSIEGGHCEASPIGYIYYAALLSALQQYEQADAFGQLALKLNQNFGGPAMRAPIDHMYASFAAHWRHPINKVLAHLQRSVMEGAEFGIFNSAGWAALNLTSFLLIRGVELTEVYQKAIEYGQIAKDVLKYQDIFQYQLAMQHIVLDLTGKQKDKRNLNNEGRSVEAIDQSLAHYVPALGYLNVHRLFVFCVMREHNKALKSLEVTRQTAAIIPQGPAFGALKFYENLLFFELFENAEETERKEFLSVMEANLAQYAVWSGGSPENFSAKHMLMEVELDILKGAEHEILEKFDDVITRAQADNLLHIEAIALERVGRYCLSLNQKRMARGYLIDAHLSYMRWGAMGKVYQLEGEFPTLRSSQQSQSFLDVGLASYSGSHSAVTSSSRSQEHLDLLSIQKATQAISSELALDELLLKILRLVLENVGAQKGCLFLKNSRGELRLEAEIDSLLGFEKVQQSVPLDDAPAPVSLIRFVARSQEQVVLDNAILDERFGSDIYICEYKTKSLICMPVRTQNKIVGVLYVENQSLAGAFTAERCSVLEILAGQAAISLENALLYSELEAKVSERTLKLSQTLEQLEDRHIKLQNTQVQLVESEKMASLGGMVAGVAHEINNPANFSFQGALNLEQRLGDFRSFILELAETEPGSELEIMFDEKFSPMFKNLSAIVEGTQRIKEIVDDLRNFSRLDEAEFKRSDVISGLESALTIFLANSLDDMDVVRLFHHRPELDCWPAQLNQVFMNIMLNAHQAVIEQKRRSGDESFRGQLQISTEVDSAWLQIKFTDNGCGMSNDVVQRVFEPFFTTRPVGDGTGLGMSIAYGIVQKHKGKIKIQSAVGEGSTVVVMLPMPGM